MAMQTQNTIWSVAKEDLIKAANTLGFDASIGTIQHEHISTRIDNLKKISPLPGSTSDLSEIEIYTPALNPEWVISSAEWESLLSLQHACAIVKAGCLQIGDKNCGFIVRVSNTTLERADLKDEDNCIRTLFHICEYLLSINSNSGGVADTSIAHGFLNPGCITIDKIPRQTWVSGLNYGKLARLSGRLDGSDAQFSNHPTWRISFLRPGYDRTVPRLADDLWAACVIALWQANGGEAFRQAPQEPDEMANFYAETLKLITNKSPGLAKILEARLLDPGALEKDHAIELILDDCVRVLKNNDFKSPLFYGTSYKKKTGPGKGILVFGNSPIDENPRWLVSDTRVEDIEVRSKFLHTPSNPILITGPSGTGKTQLAHAIHNRIYNGNDHFKEVNCGALTRELMMSQVFGHVKGTFTGANRDKPGILQDCATGTVFLDEIDRMDKEAQGQFLKVLDEPHEYYPLGGEDDEEQKKVCTATLIFATNKNISDLISSHVLEDDIYFRISHFFTIDLKPLISNQEALEHALRIHWSEKKKQLCALEYGLLEVKFPEAWKTFTDRSIVHYDGNHRDLKKLVTEVIFRLKVKKERNEPESISTEEAREILMLVDNIHSTRKTETPFSELRLEEQVAKLAAVVVANPDMKRIRAAQLLGLQYVSQINKVIADIKEMKEKPDWLSDEQWKAIGKFVKARKEKS